MKKLLNTSFTIALSILAVLFVSSCLDHDINDIEEQQRAAIQKYVEGKGFTHIGYDVYLKFYNREGIDIKDSNVVYGNYFTINFDGAFLDESIWETTDSAKGAALFPNRYYIYGPLQLRSGEIISFALDTAIKYFSAGDTGTIVAPSWYAYGTEPNVFHIGLKQVIKNDTANELEKFSDYFVTNDFSENNELYSGVYWKHPTDPSYVISDTIIHKNSPKVKIELVGRFAETYYSSGLGRQFYPLTSVGDSLEMTIDVGKNKTFPFIPAIDSAIVKMNVGDELEITGGSGIGWGSKGYFLPDLNIPIVPANMPLHYKIKLVEVFE
jgi:FKBP-type peptidyl-prolyl cis-trans isomerase